MTLPMTNDRLGQCDLNRNSSCMVADFEQPSKESLDDDLPGGAPSASN